MVWLVTAQLWAAFSVQLPVFEMQAPIQKIKNGRCRKTPKGLPMAERDRMLGLSGIKDSYPRDNGGSTASSQSQTPSCPWLSA